MHPQSTPLASIYRILDPRTLAVVYIGRTAGSLPERLAGHLSKRGLCPSIGVPFYEWLQVIVDERGLMPLIELVEACPAEIVEWRERFWYCHYRLRGACLLNQGAPSCPSGEWGAELGHRPSVRFWYRGVDYRRLLH